MEEKYSYWKNSTEKWLTLFVACVWLVLLWIGISDYRDYVKIGPEIFSPPLLEEVLTKKLALCFILAMITVIQGGRDPERAVCPQ